MCVVSGVCLSVFATASQYAHLLLLFFVLILYLPINNFNHIWTNFCLQLLLFADDVSCPMTQHSGDSQILAICRSIV